ncbi:Flp pilus assembly protein TadD, contains TPR repeats [Porphyromonadaceae bacterium NLAE-zl-C104]|nr:Flp pilus assembly protein TadD, contains TPR repeats [Porphyromonadaceae bacterium NLAE-zl-C104]
MKRILFLTMIAILSTGSILAQKSAVRDAKRALGRDDLKEARTLIQQASTNPETAADPETWKVMGDIGNKTFDNERTKTMLNQDANEKVMYDGLMESYKPYLKADSLGELPDEKGRVRNRVRKDISNILRANHPFYINGGVYYNEQSNYAKAADFFEVYWDIPTLPMFADQKDAFVLDSTYQTIKYYAIISAISADQNERAIAMLERAAKEPFIENSAYKESDIYELLASQHERVGDSAKFIETLNLGAQKFPDSKYFVPNLINVFIRSGQSDKAMEYLDQAIANDPANSCDLNSVKGALFAEKGDYAAAEAEYKKALAQDSNCERALENLARNYIIQAQELKEVTATLSSRQQQVENDKKTVELYQQALPLLEKMEQVIKARNASQQEINGVLMLLRNAYYNLSVLGVDKSAELKVVEDQLNLE